MGSKMDFPPEPKPINETKSDEEYSDNFIMNVPPASDENDEKAGFSAGNYNSQSEDVENRTAEVKLYFGATSRIEQIDSEDSEKQKMNVTEKCKTDDKCDDLQLHVNENEEKEVLEVENNFIQPINSQEDILKDGSYASSIETNSLGIKKRFEACGDFAAENKDKINHDMFEDSSAKQFPDLESFNFTKDTSNKQETGDKNDCLQLHVNENEEKEVLEVDNDFMQQINPQEDVSRDGSYASSIETNSSGIENDFEDCSTENEDEMNDIIFEDASRKKENEVSENLSFEKKEENINLINNEDNILKEDKDVVSSHDSVSLFESITFPYKNPANCFDVVVPLIGKNVIAVGDIQPFNHRYDLAREINRLKGIEDAPYLPKLSYHEWRKQRDARPQEEKDREERHEKLIAIETAAYIVQVATFILQEMQKDDPDEGIIERCFIRFLRAPVSPMSLLLSSHFVHVMMYIRGSSDFSHRLRYVADRCYMRCHVMFPILEGYNFETIYTSEVIKNIPEQLDGMRNFLLDYGDFEYPVSESDDSAFSDDNEED